MEASCCCCSCLRPCDDKRKRRKMKISAPITIREATHEQSSLSDGLRFKYVSTAHTTSGPSVIGENREIELQLISDRIMTMTFPLDGSEVSYARSLKDVSQMLERQYKKNYQIINLSERRADLAKLNSRVVDFGIPPLVVCPVATLVLACRQVMQWLRSGAHHVIVFHCKGEQARLATFVAAYMSFCSSNTRVSEDVLKEKLALKQLYDAQLSKNCGPSHRRYLQFFSAVISGRIASNAGSKRSLTLHSVTLSGLHKFFASGLCVGSTSKTSSLRPRLFIKVYQNMTLAHTTPVYTINGPKERVRFPIEPAVALSGDVLLKCFFKRAPNACRETLFRVQFNTGTVAPEKIFFSKDELDVACLNAKFPINGRIDLLFKASAVVTKEFDKAIAQGRLGVDRTQDPIVRWDSYEDFHNANVYTSIDYVDSGGRIHGPMNQEHASRLAAIQHTAGPVDGSPYAEVVRDTLISTSVRNTTNQHVSPGASGPWHVASHDSGFSSTPGSGTAGKLRMGPGVSPGAGLSASDARELDRLLEELRVAGETAVTSVQRGSTQTRPAVQAQAGPTPTFRTSLTRVHQDLSTPATSNSFSTAATRRDQLGYESEPEGTSFAYMRRPEQSGAGESASDREMRLLSELRSAKLQLETLRKEKEGAQRTGAGDEIFDINFRYSALGEAGSAAGGRRRHRSQQESAFIDPPTSVPAPPPAAPLPNGVPPPHAVPVCSLSPVSPHHHHHLVQTNTHHHHTTPVIPVGSHNGHTHHRLTDIPLRSAAAPPPPPPPNFVSDCPVCKAHADRAPIRSASVEPQHVPDSTDFFHHSGRHQLSTTSLRDPDPYGDTDTTLADLERTLQAASEKIYRERMTSGYSAHRENQKVQQQQQQHQHVHQLPHHHHHLHHHHQQPHQHVHQHQTTHVVTKKEETPGEIYEEIETVTLQPIGKGVHDLEGSSGIGRTMSGYRSNGTQSMDRLHQVGGSSGDQYFYQTYQDQQYQLPQRAKTPQPRDMMMSSTLQSNGRRRHMSHEFVNTADMRMPTFEVTPPNGFATLQHQQSSQFWNTGQKLPVTNVPVQLHSPPAGVVASSGQSGGTLGREKSGYHYHVQKQQSMGSPLMGQGGQTGTLKQQQQQQQQYQHQVTSTVVRQQPLQQPMQIDISAVSNPSYQQQHFSGRTHQEEMVMSPQQRFQQQQRQEHFVSVVSQPQDQLLISQQSQPSPQQRAQQQQQEHFVTMSSQQSPQQRAQQQQQEHFVTLTSQQSPQQRAQQQQQEHFVTLTSQQSPQQRAQQQQQEHFVTLTSQQSPQQRAQQQQQEHFVTMTSQQSPQQRAQQQQQEHFVTMTSQQSPQQRAQQQQQEHFVTMTSQQSPQRAQHQDFFLSNNQQSSQSALSRHIQQQQQQEVFSNTLNSGYQAAGSFQQQFGSKANQQQLQEQQLLQSMINQQQQQQQQNSGGGTWTSNDIVDGANSTPKFVRDTTKLWYKPNISREEAIRLLRSRPPGSFIVRDSNSFPGAFGLAVKVAQMPQGVTPKSDDMESELVRHFLIEPTSKGVRLKGCSNEPVFGSLTALIYQHTVTALALPCRLVIPMAPGEMTSVDGMMNSMSGGGGGTILRGSSGVNSEQWMVLFLGTVEVESLTGSNAVVRSIDTLLDEFHPGRQTTECQLKLSADGVTLTDTQRKLFFRRHYQPSAVSFCGIDPKDRCWSGPEITARNMRSSRLFGLITRKQSGPAGVVTDNLCHVFCELVPAHSAANIVASLSRYLQR